MRFENLDTMLSPVTAKKDDISVSSRYFDYCYKYCIMTAYSGLNGKKWITQEKYKV